MTSESKDILRKAEAHVRYELKDGTFVPGVTTVTGLSAKPGLVVWANKLGLDGINVRTFVDELAIIGTLAHYLIETKLKGETPELGDYTQNQIKHAEKCVKKFDDWIKETSLK